MKTNLLRAYAMAFAMIPLYNCSVEPVEQMVPEQIIIETSTTTLFNENDNTVCVGELPKSRVTNNSEFIVNYEVRNADGDLITYVYDLNPGQISDWKTFPVGVTTFSLSTSETTKAVTIDMGTCMAYDVEIDENRQLNTDVAIQL